MEVYNLSNRNELIAVIEELDSIRVPLEKLKEKSGIEIDEYGTSRLYLDHIKFIISCGVQSNQWKEIFEIAIKEKCGLLIIGD
ncbi:hypothetical protein [Aureivirga sp. CE67]|uniref:hypothetical protein n=1 Tax=Aureivirga sp. CE67 TaxID=1788983 RepID=UPI0018C998A4|nr:hypothetical protein [Aureivirga sp. CE67]